MKKFLFILLDWLSKAILRFLFSGITYFVVYLFLRFLFDPPNTKFITFFENNCEWKNWWIITSLGAFSIFIDWYNKLLPDRLHNIFRKFIGSFKLGDFSSFFIKEYFNENKKNVSLISLNELDEFVFRLYHKSKGEIFLFNPSLELFDCSIREWSDIRKAINKNKNKLKKITVLLPDVSKVNKNAATDLLGVKVEIIEIKEEYKDLAKTTRFAIYHFDPDLMAKQPKIDYLVNRPMRQPFNDKFLLIYDYESLNDAISDDDKKLYEFIRDLKNGLLKYETNKENTDA